MDERRLEMKVGALVLAALVGVLGLLWLMGELTLGRDTVLSVDFSHTGNVVKGSPVKLGGVVVGRVEERRGEPESLTRTPSSILLPPTLLEAVCQ
jgi:phospholipid/cholesterol/gamma-HCH transport system substrate-binding protein